VLLETTDDITMASWLGDCGHVACVWTILWQKEMSWLIHLCHTSPLLEYTVVVLQDEHLESVAPVLGIAAAVGGYTVMELNQDLLTLSVTEGLTEDAVTARLHEGAQTAKRAAV
jgi:hypothetical protein